MNDKRRYHRMRIAVPMSFVTPPDQARPLATTLDISGLGLSFETDRELKVRQELLMYLLLPGEDRVEAHGRVARVERISPSRFKIGVEIVDPIKFDEKKLVKFYAAQLKEFFSPK